MKLLGRPNGWSYRIAVFGGCLLSAGVVAASPLSDRGYSVLPEPQSVALRPDDAEFARDWLLVLEEGVAPTDAAIVSLKEGLASRFHLQIKSAGRDTTAKRIVSLAIRSGSVLVGQAADRNRAALSGQAYRLTLTSNRVSITANAPAGLFYGVQTFLQLLTPNGSRLKFPEGEIQDWPDLELRIIYWDDAHHLERLEVLKQAIQQAAFYKINGFALKLEGHFRYRSAAPIVEPYALSPAQLQELTDFALRYHVQLIPYLDAPAHVSFILKHPEYASLRAFPNCNYEFCVVNPQTYALLFGMFQDLLDANRRGKYFLLSTDEPYYVGMSNRPGTDEAGRAAQLGGVGKLLAEFITRCAVYLHQRGRTVIFWGEYPLKPEDIRGLPRYLVSGETGGPKWDPEFRKHGIRQLIYTSTQGEEPLFPNYYPLPASERVHATTRPEEAGRVTEMMRTITLPQTREQADLMGTFVAAWADAGLHPETFWLGYTTGPAAAWNPRGPGADETTKSFCVLFYGSGQQDMSRVYELMSRQARFWDDSWERTTSRARTPIFGNSQGLFNPPRPAHDQTLPPLPRLSAVELKPDGDWSAPNARRLQLAHRFLAENDELLTRIRANLSAVQFNRYNLEVFLSIALLCRENLEMLKDLGRIDELLKTASGMAPTAPASALAQVDEALELVQCIWRRRNQVYAQVVAKWYKSWLPRVAEANGRRYLDQVDDVKDHLPVRTVDMSYLIYRELQYPLGEWAQSIRASRNQFAKAHGLAPRSGNLEWRNTR